MPVVIGGSGAFTGGGNTGGLPPGSGVPASNVTDLTCSGIVNPSNLVVTLTVSFTPPSDPDDTFSGVTLWLLIPAPTSDTVTTVSPSTTVGSSTTAAPGLQNAINIWSGQAPFTFPLTITTLFPLTNGLDPNTAYPCTLYCTSNSPVTQNPLINTTPSVNFTLEPSTGSTPTAATNITTATAQGLIVNEVGSQTVSGKMITGIIALVETVPDKLPTGWNYILVGIQEGSTTQQKLTGPETVAGPVPAPTNGDGFTLGQTSFVMQTPSATTNWTIYLVSGLGTKYNNIVPGQTPSCPLRLDAGGSGVLSAIDIIESTISSELSIAEGKFGITAGGVTGNMIESATIDGTKIVLASLTGSLLAAETITGTLIAGETITGTLLATSGIITESAQVGSAVIASASIISLGVEQLTAGTATFTATATFEYGFGGPSVVIASVGIEIINGSNSIELTSSAITVETSSATLSLSTTIDISSGSNYLTISSSEIILSHGGAGNTYYPNVVVFSGSVYVSASASDYIEIQSGTITIVSDGYTATIAGNQATFENVYVSNALTLNSGGTTFLNTNTCQIDGTVICTTLEVNTIKIESATLYTSASPGSNTLPPNPVGFAEITLNVSGINTTYKFPLYGI